jgi:hypothetical protein
MACELYLYDDLEKGYRNKSNDSLLRRGSLAAGPAADIAFAIGFSSIRFLGCLSFGVHAREQHRYERRFDG